MKLAEKLISIIESRANDLSDKSKDHEEAAQDELASNGKTKKYYNQKILAQQAKLAGLRATKSEYGKSGDREETMSKVKSAIDKCLELIAQYKKSASESVK